MRVCSIREMHSGLALLSQSDKSLKTCLYMYMYIADQCNSTEGKNFLHRAVVQFS